MKNDLKNKSILIFGATSWILTDTIKKLKENSCRLYLSSSRSIKGHIKCNFADLEELEKDIINLKNKVEDLDCIIFASHSQAVSSLASCNKTDFLNAFKFSTIAPFMVLKELESKLLKDSTKKDKSVLFVSSMYSKYVPDFEVYKDTKSLPSPIYYGAAKSSMNYISRYLARFYGERAIRFNTISPGAFPNSKNSYNNSKLLKNLSQKNALKRLGAPEDLSALVLFLCSNNSSFITGENFSIDGGWSS